MIGTSNRWTIMEGINLLLRLLMLPESLKMTTLSRLCYEIQNFLSVSAKPEDR